MIEYKIVQGVDRFAVEKKVNEFLSIGYALHGGVSMFCGNYTMSFAQALVKEKQAVKCNDEIMNLRGDELDCSVAIAMKHKAKITAFGCKIADWNKVRTKVNGCRFNPNNNGQQLLEIMEREKISVTPCAPDLWEAEIVIDDIFYVATGKTINEAVLRCYLLGKQGGKNG